MRVTRETIERAREAKEYVTDLNDRRDMLTKGERRFVDQIHIALIEYDDGAVFTYEDMEFLEELYNGCKLQEFAACEIKGTIN